MADECWFHGDLSTRQEAEDRLRDAASHDEGLFLVRHSTSADGDFVLSVVHESSVIHYQIRRRGGGDAMFSLSDEEKVIPSQFLLSVLSSQM